jgi:hypothetical protein
MLAGKVKGSGGASGQSDRSPAGGNAAPVLLVRSETEPPLPNCAPLKCADLGWAARFGHTGSNANPLGHSAQHSKPEPRVAIRLRPPGPLVESLRKGWEDSIPKRGAVASRPGSGGVGNQPVLCSG